MIPRIHFQFTNGRYIQATNKYLLDIMVRSDTPEVIFGVNVRIHYDATKLKPSKASFINFAEGYGMQNQASISTGISGKGLFGLSTTPMTYINWAIELKSPIQAKPLTNLFSRLLTIETECPQLLPIGHVFAPSFIFDCQNVDGSGGFVPGPSGLTVTVVNQLGATSGLTTTKQCYRTVTHWNWKDNLDTVIRPFGTPNNDNSITI